MPRCRFQPDQWAQWVQDRSVSNLSVADFCAIHQLPVHSFFILAPETGESFQADETEESRGC